MAPRLKRKEDVDRFVVVRDPRVRRSGCRSVCEWCGGDAMAMQIQGDAEQWKRELPREWPVGNLAQPRAKCAAATGDPNLAAKKSGGAARAASADLPSTHRQPSSILSATAQNFFFALCHRRRAKKAHGRQKLGLTKLRRPLGARLHLVSALSPTPLASTAAAYNAAEIFQVWSHTGILSTTPIWCGSVELVHLVASLDTIQLLRGQHPKTSQADRRLPGVPDAVWNHSIRLLRTHHQLSFQLVHRRVSRSPPCRAYSKDGADIRIVVPADLHRLSASSYSQHRFASRQIQKTERPSPRSHQKELSATFCLDRWCFTSSCSTFSVRPPMPRFNAAFNHAQTAQTVDSTMILAFAWVRQWPWQGNVEGVRQVRRRQARGSDCGLGGLKFVAAAHLERPLPVGKDVVVVVDHAAAHAVVASRHHAAGCLAGCKRLLVGLGARAVRANHLLHLVDCEGEREMLV
ncbi:hypothetical protein L1887_55279 [Cichorium endivia]|nr:hypothetical protein L1887_55279 [Cichorium endivia]